MEPEEVDEVRSQDKEGLRMKRVKDGFRIMAGQIDTGIKHRLQLWDGKWTTGYRVTKVEIAPDFPTSGEEFAGKLHTQQSTTMGDWDWGDIEQIAWMSWGVPLNSRYSQTELIRADHMIIEDLWISVYTPGEAGKINYYIEMEKYEFPAWDGAANLVRNNSQAGPE